MKGYFRKTHKDKAQAMIEFALVFPVLLLIIYGIIEFGRLLFILSSVTTAAREAARYGSAAGHIGDYVTPHYRHCAGMREAARRGAILVEIPDTAVDIDYDHGPGTSQFGTCAPAVAIASLNPEAVLGDRVVVRIEVPYEPVIPFVNFASFPIVATSQRTIMKAIDIKGTPAPASGGSMPTVYFTLSSQDVGEAIGTIQVVAEMNGTTINNVTVPLTFGGSADGGLDFIVSDNKITIPAGSLSGVLTIDIVDDLLDEEDVESFTVIMGTPTFATKGTPDIHTVNITDNDDPPDVYFTEVGQTVDEGVGNIAATLELSQFSGKDVQVGFSISGTAELTNDYLASPSPVTIPKGVKNAVVVVMVVDDVIDEDAEDLTIGIDSVVNATKGSPNEHTVIITDNDLPPTVSFSIDQLIAPENIGAKVIIQAVLSAPTAREVTVPYLRAGTATHGDDYMVTVSPLVFPKMQTSVDVEFTLVDDGLVEPDETVLLEMQMPTNATLASPSDFALTITSALPPPVISFQAAGQNVAENVLGNQALVTVVMSNIWTEAIDVPYTVGGTAIAGLDYTVPIGPVTIPIGQVSVNIVVTLLNDALDEDNETVIFHLGLPSFGTTQDPIQHILVIEDEDLTPTVSFAGDESQSGPEDVGTMDATVTLSAASSKDVYVYFGYGGTATVGTCMDCDYTISASPVMIPAGATSANIIITVNDDLTAGEADETVVITLQSADNATVAPPEMHTATITENDYCPTASGNPQFLDDKLVWNLNSSNPLLVMNLVKVSLTWPTTSEQLDTITFAGSITIWNGSEKPPYLEVSGTPLWSGAFASNQMVYKFKKTPTAGNYTVTAEFSGCTAISGSANK